MSIEKKEDFSEIVDSESDLKSDKVDIFSDIRYICRSTSLILDSLQRGFDVAQLPSGDVVVTEIKVVNTHYTWNRDKHKMVKIGQS
ncbi:DUF2671 domain-containing protein [Rickettsia endosymbiont of Cardiosporidium cionae]|uniref:DUF2671 domain-containing protein n=1 Tax=Rickettsia endosymbiont of Cardiosporidium cionae TaxID=2777155 RepID=UPI0018932052|nr:DUF2671 domain-containing protein [Rickettsia endosymbiont of Cardiosporidium cionae]KAF8818966.1 hypothetical protein IHI24_000201 [Rickettsia endosymbiont of Cardiosporidium cionae]